MKIFISGVSSGLGYGLAKVYLAMGHAVYGCSRRKPEDLVDQGLHFAAIDLADSMAALLNHSLAWQAIMRR